MLTITADSHDSRDRDGDSLYVSFADIARLVLHNRSSANR